jgi:hypothetical protein
MGKQKVRLKRRDAARKRATRSTLILGNHIVLQESEQ